MAIVVGFLMNVLFGLWRFLLDAIEVGDPDAQWGGKEARQRLERKMGILVVIYILNYIDRNNAGAARLKGFEADLKLKGQEFATLLSILYVGYIIMQGKPSLYLPACMLVWGMISVLTGFFVGALLTRFFLGFVEAAFFPGSLFLLSKWYKKDEIGLRTAILYCGNIISNAFGTLMASGILSGMQGDLGHAAWRWLFYIEGALTMAGRTIFILPDFPATTTWLTPEERALALHRMAEDYIGIGDQDETESEGHFNGLLLALKDWKVWWMAFALTSQVIALSFNAYFPTLAKTINSDSTIALVLCAPPFIFAAILAFLLARHSDKTQERFWHITSSFILGIIGFIISLSTTNKGARYFALFLHAQSYAGFVCMYSWLPSMFPRPPSKRAVALALINAFSQLGNISGSYIWPTPWGPSYRYSYGICVACCGLAIAMNFIMRTYLAGQNRKFEAEEQKTGAPKGFRYIL
ncbi:MFS general substrate transporter [Flagelloscypha sp. PMI_526]|nr:MFS general substrate transporter [Flagelloscypha sp. PMI_526]